MTLNERRQYEFDLYKRLNKNKEGQRDADDSILFYVIEGQWMQDWIHFIEQAGDLPNEIDNSSLRNYILQWKQQHPNYQGVDNEIELKKRQDYFELSPDLWRMFYDHYGCKPVILVRYFNQAADGIMSSVYKDLS